MDDKDARTLDFYAVEAQAYAGRPRDAEHLRIDRFVAHAPAGGRILELGCGGGQDSAEMLARGFDVVPTDGSPELAAEAEKRLGQPVRVLLFEDLAEIDAYDGIWAHACLLHAPRAALPGIIDRIHAALKPGGVFYASFKAGETEGRDGFGRYFNYLSAADLALAYGSPSRWQELTIDEDMGGGYDQKPTRWLHALALKEA